MLQTYYARARIRALHRNLDDGHELRSSLIELEDEHDRFPELVLGPDEGLQDHLNMEERTRQQAEFAATVYHDMEEDDLVSPGIPHSGHGSVESSDLGDTDSTIVDLVAEGFTLAEATAVTEARRTALFAAEASIIASIASAKVATMMAARIGVPEPEAGTAPAQGAGTQSKATASSWHSPAGRAKASGFDTTAVWPAAPIHGPSPSATYDVDGDVTMTDSVGPPLDTLPQEADPSGVAPSVGTSPALMASTISSLD